MKPGIYGNLPEREYREDPALSQSTLCEMRRSPAHARYKLDRPRQTDAMLLGSVVHSLVLPGAPCPYISTPAVDRRTKVGREIVAAREAEAKATGNTIIPIDVEVEATKIQNAVEEHSEALAILCSPKGRSEVSIFWEGLFGVPCKGRIDWLDEPVIWDLKTTRDASAESFARSVLNFGYHIQAAHYLLGCSTLGLQVNRFGIIAVETEPPYAVAVYELDATWIDLGIKECERLTALWNDCTRANEWPGYPKGVQLLSPPDWLLRRQGTEMAI